MKKLLSLIFFLAFTISGSAIEPYQQTQKNRFSWNKSIEASFGYDHLYSTFSHDSYGHMSPTELMQVDMSIFGIYFGVGYWAKDTGYKVYGFDERISTYIFKLGPSFRYRFSNNQGKIVFTPYFGWGNCTVGDSSNNAIGQRQDYGDVGPTIYMGGIKLSIAYKYLEFGINASNKEAGISFGVNLDMD